MELNTLTAISPIDGRYHKQLHSLDDYFSEFALIKYRVLVEVEYFLFLGDKKIFSLPAAARKNLQSVTENFSLQDAAEIKTIENITNHDVKAVEYFLKKKLDEAKAGNTRGMDTFRADLAGHQQHAPFPCCGNMLWKWNTFLLY